MVVKLTHFITELDTGGAQIALLRLLTHIDRTRFDPSVICLYNGDKVIAREIEQLGIPVIDLKMAARWRWDSFWRLIRQLRLTKPAILHTWMFHANIPGRLAGRWSGVPVIVCGERTMGQENRWRYWLNRITQRYADQVVCVSQEVARFTTGIIGIPAQKVKVISNGISLSSFSNLPSQEDARKVLGLPQGRLLIGTVAKLRPVKRVDVLLRAVKNLEGVTTVIIGEGRERVQLDALADKLGIREQVIFAGYQEDVPLWLKALDIFVLSSDWEGMPNAVLEAMAAGLPVVATCVGGIIDIVVDGETGILVPTDNPDAITNAIQRLVDNPDFRRKLGEAGRDQVSSNFNILETVRQTEDLYGKLLTRAGIEQ